jgi:hypothetical protein
MSTFLCVKNNNNNNNTAISILPLLIFFNLNHLIGFKHKIKLFNTLTFEAIANYLFPYIFLNQNAIRIQSVYSCYMWKGPRRLIVLSMYKEKLNLES